MENNTYYQALLYERHAISLSSSIIIIGGMIGVIGNTTIIFFYFFVLKEEVNDTSYNYWQLLIYLGA